MWRRLGSSRFGNDVLAMVISDENDTHFKSLAVNDVTLPLHASRVRLRTPESGGSEDRQTVICGPGTFPLSPPKGEGPTRSKRRTEPPLPLPLDTYRSPPTNHGIWHMAAKPWSMGTILCRTHPLRIMRQPTHMQTHSLISVCF